jgi:hypothetical protein
MPKNATQASRDTLSDVGDASRRCARHVARKNCELKKPLRHGHFLHCSKMPMPIDTALFASSCERRRACASDPRCAIAVRSVNTSLSGTLFFSTCWCIRDVVHLDSRVHTANQAISLTLEGNMAKKAKKAKKAKSAVKKTAKKTRKVAKKKK